MTEITSGKPDPVPGDLVGVDPVTFEVIHHRLRSIVERQSNALRALSGSMIVTQAGDYNVGLYLSDGSIVVMGQQVISHSGSMSRVIRHVIADCEQTVGIQEGDSFIVNDPYKGALHAQDVAIVKPLFHDGARMGWTGSCAHQVDMGGMILGSWCSRATEVQQEACLLPPIKLVERGKLREDLWNLIMGMVRVPGMVGLDLKAMMATNNVGEEGVKGLIAKYGPAAVQTVMFALLDRSERKMRDRLRELPDGTFRARNYLDHDGHENRLYRIAVTLRKEGDVLTFDLSESSGQAPGFVNCTEAGMIGGIFSALLPALAWDIPWNAGVMRPVTILAPEGLICNARRPAPCSMATVGAGSVLRSAASASLSRMLACSQNDWAESRASSMGATESFTIGGVNQYGEPFGSAFGDTTAGGGGAMADRDGIDAGGAIGMLAPRIGNVEWNESVAPQLYLERGYIRDSGGPGRFRGGRSIGVKLRVHDAPSLLTVFNSHGVEVPNALGAFGGHPGSCIQHLLVAEEEGLASARDLGAKPGPVQLGPADVLIRTWQGGGGYEDPLDRPPQRVAEDVESAAVSVEAALSQYGVVIREGAVDEETTALRRAAIRKSRKRRPVKKSAWQGQVLHVLGRCGPGLQFIQTNRGPAVSCLCGALLGPASENWKDYATAVPISPSQAGPLVRLHADLELREYACPGCGRLLSVELAEGGSPPLKDVDIGW